ncbi:tRNA (adenine(22)-N(1))-methyltransferase [Salinibacillus xinjiangensis]|nr:tRNA (adenine(22)-N(1))-methyltransferase TrmK [Salinibacillus xinjiangensis]
MTDINISERLKRISQYIPPKNKFADIGSDHAYLPCYVCLEDLSASAIAGEINQGPFQKALEQVNRYDLQNRIEVRQGDGLSVIYPKEVQSVVIAGMGGTLITSILEQGHENLRGVKRIITQPNINAKSIRQWFNEHNYDIVSEEVLEEDGYFYEIVVGDYSDSDLTTLSEKELYLGPINLRNKGDAFIQKWSSVLDKKIHIVKQMKEATQPDKVKITEFEQQINWIKEEL